MNFPLSCKFQRFQNFVKGFKKFRFYSLPLMLSISRKGVNHNRHCFLQVTFQKEIVNGS